MKTSNRCFQLTERLLPLAILMFTPVVALAHPGHGPASGFTHGLLHPLTGIDHIVAMVAVGIWAAQQGGRATWMVPLSFVSVMAVGGALGMAGVALPFVEPGIIASVLVLGLLIAAAVRLPTPVSAGIVGLFALFHGHAHGVEMPETASGLAYGLGFVGATIALHAAGLGLGLGLQRMNRSDSLARFAGGAIAACGIYLCFAG